MRIEEVIAKALERTLNDRYMLSNVVFTRVKQLESGSKPLVNIDIKKHKLSDIALIEIAEGKILVDKITQA